MFDCKNVSSLIRKQAELHPNKDSIVFPVGRYPSYTYTKYSFLELDQRINKICNRLKKLGVKPGHKVLFFVKPNLDFCAITFALFRLGAITVFIDPGMKREHFFTCIKQVRPDVLVGIPIVHYLRKLFPSVFGNIKINISTSKFNGIFTSSLFSNIDKEPASFNEFIPTPKSLAAILFTSGGTGIPKGVEYTHDIFINQTRMLKEEFSLTHEDVDIPGFPLFSFFTLAMGMTSVIPDMNPSKPNKCNPAKLYQNIIDSKATFIAGSPAIWTRLVEYCLEKKLTLPSVKYTVMFGAPVSIKIHKDFEEVLTNGTTYTPYGATECLPVANNSGALILSTTAQESISGKGICVGKPLNGVDVKIIKRSDDIISNLSDVQFMPTNQVGEIIVNSPNVTKAYYQMEDKTLLAKIYDGDLTYHRMGDVGFLDNEGKLWFCGRMKHVVDFNDKSYYPTQVEAIFNNHPEIKRSALVSNNGKPVIFIESESEISTKLRKELLSLTHGYSHLEGIEEFYTISKFPVDVRHNIKIDRSALSELMNHGK